MKVTIVLAGVLAANLLAVAQDPTGITTAQTNQVHQPAVFPDTFRPQQLSATNHTNVGNSTNLSSSVVTSNRVNGALISGSGTSTSSSQITIIRGSGTSTSGGQGGQLPPNGNGIDPVKNSAGTANDWRSDSSGPHVVPPRDSATNP